MAFDFNTFGKTPSEPVSKTPTLPATKSTSGFDFSSFGKPTDVSIKPQVEKKDGFLKSLIKAPLTTLARPIQAVAELGGVSDEAVNKFSKEKLGGFVAPTPQNFSDVRKDVGRGIQTVALGLPGVASAGATFGLGSSLEKGNDLTSLDTAFETALGAGGGKILGFVGKPLIDTAGKVIGKITPQVLKDVASKGSTAIQEFASRHNIFPENISKGINTGADKLENVVNKPFELSFNQLQKAFTPSEKSIERKVLDKYTKGVKPLLPGKTTPGSEKKYKDNVITAVKSIKANQQNLSFTDETGEKIVGQTPKSLQELTNAVDQTKKSIFSQYDALAKKAGESGVKIKTKPIASELDSVINNKALALTNPKAVQYAKAVKDRYAKIGNLDANTAQEVIQNYNKSLEAFYRNPSYDSASQAAVDAMVANNMRESLDKGISELTGKQYQALKNQYGALKSIEKDVIKASLRDARKNSKGLIDFTDIFSGGEIVNGLLSMNPASVGKGVGSLAIKNFYKYLNDPNRAIEKMFSISEKLPTLKIRGVKKPSSIK